ncbi:MAG: hypothetical protein ACLUI2_01580 [Christensenellales bacterium]
MKIKSAAFCKKLETELSERKRRTRRIESSRLQEVYSRNPEIKKLDDNLATIAFDMGRQLMNAGNSEEIRGLANALIEKKQRERRELLVSSGFPAGKPVNRALNYKQRQYSAEELRALGVDLGDDVYED